MSTVQSAPSPTSRFIAATTMILVSVYILNVNNVTYFIKYMLGLSDISASITATSFMIISVFIIEYMIAPFNFMRSKRVLALFDAAWLTVAAVSITISSAKFEEDTNYKFALYSAISHAKDVTKLAILAERAYHDFYVKDCAAHQHRAIPSDFCSELDKLDSKIVSLTPLSADEIRMLEYASEHDKWLDTNNLIHAFKSLSISEAIYNKKIWEVYPSHNYRMIDWWFVTIVVLGLRFLKTVHEINTKAELPSLRKCQME
jgi:hypothetical protein